MGAGNELGYCRKMRRRDALKRLGALAGAAASGPLLGGCGDGESEELGITTVVTLMMENRSYDHFLGARALEGLGGNGLRSDISNPDGDGNPVRVFHDGEVLVPDPPHGWTASHRQFNDGANDGFLTEYLRYAGAGVPPHVMGYLTREELPFLWALADSGTVCDAWFSSIMGPTYPNRAYLHSAQSGGIMLNEGIPGSWGWPTIYSRLDEAGVDWAYYYSDLPVLPLFSTVELSGRMRRMYFDFFDDALAGTLPPVVFLDPAFSCNDDHPPHHPMLGQQFMASVYAALAESPQWNNILLLITYDEHGGFFDHVPPPTTADDREAEGFGQLGFRVPTVAAGPYVKAGQVSSVVYEHCSILAHIEGMFGLEPLVARDAAARDLGDVIDLERLAAGEPAPPAPMPAIEIDESMIEDATLRRRSALTDLEIIAEAGGFDPAHDARGETRDLLYAIGDTLDRLNAGRIRRGR